MDAPESRLSAAAGSDGRDIVHATVVALLVGLLSWGTIWVRDTTDSVALWWPAAGVAVAGVVTARPRARVWIVLLVLVTSAAGNLLAGRPPTVSVLFGAANALEAAVAGWWLLRGTTGRPSLASITDLWRLVVAAVLGAFVIAVGATATVVLVGDGSAWPTFLHVLASHACAVMLLVPLVLHQPRERWEAGRLEAGFQIAAVVACTVAIFAAEPRLSQAFLLVPVLLWGAMRLPLRVTTWETSLSLIGALLLTVFGPGPLDTRTVELSAGGSSGALADFVLTELFVLSTVGIVLSLAITVSQRRALLTQVRRSERILRGGFDDALLGSVILQECDGAFEIVEINDVAADLLDVGPERRVDCEQVFGASSPLVVSALTDVATGRRSSWRRELELAARGGGIRWADIVASDLTDEPGMLVVQLAETTDRKEAERQLEHLAIHDTLTGLANRTLLRDRLERAVDLADSFGEPVAVVMLDLDDFGRFNDSAGHVVGDEILATVADRIRAAARPGDTVARVGGDEFAFVLPGAGRATVEATLERLRGVLDEPLTVSTGTYRVGASIGVAPYDAGTTVDALLRDAGTAMHRAKALGPGRAVWYDESFHEQVVHVASVGSEFEGAIERGEIVLFGQPIVDLATGRTAGVEVLVRWQHPDRGLLAPGAWLDVVSAGPHGADLESWILTTSCRVLAEWHRRLGADCPSMHVNVSTALLRRGGLAEQVLASVRVAGAPADRLVVELTETDLESVGGSLRGELDELRAAGVRIAVDDFGTGFSTLSRLARLPLDELKIDRSFIAAMLTDPRADAIVTAIIGMARALNLVVVAEGVELEGESDHVRRLGCDLGQGYLWRRPGPIEDVLGPGAGVGVAGRSWVV